MFERKVLTPGFDTDNTACVNVGIAGSGRRYFYASFCGTAGNSLPLYDAQYPARIVHIASVFSINSATLAANYIYVARYGAVCDGRPSGAPSCDASGGDWTGGYGVFYCAAEITVFQLFIGKNRIEYATAYLRYEKGGKVQSLIHSLKYHDNKELGYLLGRQIARELQADHSPICTVDLLIPVPLHPRKKRQRGYNQSEWIASGIRSIWDIPIDTQSLARTTHTSTQTRKAIYDRWLNVCSIFNVIHPESLKNKHILLIDDVITTGATISACAKALSGIPGIRISILALSVA